MEDNNCKHSTLLAKYAQVFSDNGIDYLGRVEFYICTANECAIILKGVCEHLSCDWDEEGIVLTCKLCGIDAT